MTSNEIAQIEGHRMYEDDSFILLWSKGPLGISWPLLTSFHVYLKQRQLAVKATGQEKRFLLAVLREWQGLGLPLQSLKATDFFRDFSQAVAARGGVLWTSFFQLSGSPKQVAATYEAHA